MIQTTLFFILGFLCAGFLALMVAPAIWRRAVSITRRRIEASVPLTVDEIQADKDRMRAEFAMSTRRLEMSVKSFKERAAEQIVEINRNREEMKRLHEERDEQNAAISEIEARGAALRVELQQREEQLHRVEHKLIDREAQLEQRALEMERLGRMYDEASFNASSRQIEIVAQETKLEKLTGDINSLRIERKDLDTRMHEVAAESQAAREALRIERKKNANLEKKHERLLATLSDREEKLERRERELARLREQVKEDGAGSRDLTARLASEQETRVKLEAELAERSMQLSKLLSGAKGQDIEKAMAKLNGDRERLEKRLATLTKENKSLREKYDELRRSSAADWSDERREAAVLREQINDLAADVVNLTALLGEPDSPIRKALASSPSETVAGAEGIVSLADRVRALQKAAAAR